MTTPNDVALRAGGPDPEQLRAQVRELLSGLDSSAGDEHDLQAQAGILERAHDVLVRALESAEQG